MDLPFDFRQAVIVAAIAVCVALLNDHAEQAAQQAVAHEREMNVRERMRERGRQYADEVAPDMLTEGRFRRLYRLRKTSFDRLLVALGADPFFSEPGATATPLNVQVCGGGRWLRSRETLTPALRRAQLLMFLYRLAQAATVVDCATQFGLCGGGGEHCVAATRRQERIQGNARRDAIAADLWVADL